MARTTNDDPFHFLLFCLCFWSLLLPPNGCTLYPQACGNLLGALPGGVHPLHVTRRGSCDRCGVRSGKWEAQRSCRSRSPWRPRRPLSKCRLLAKTQTLGGSMAESTGSAAIPCIRSPLWPHHSVQSHARGCAAQNLLVRDEKTTPATLGKPPESAQQVLRRNHRCDTLLVL